MECEDKSMERQKLVQNDEEDDTLPTSATTQSKTPISPPNVVYSAGSDSHSQSLGKTSSEAKLSYVNERKSIELENARKASVERKKKMLKDSELISSSDNSSNLINLKRDDQVDIEMHEKPLSSSSHKTPPSLPLPSTSHPMLIKVASKNSISSSLHNFQTRNIKHHSFDNQGFQDVKNMEKNLISLLDDFHNGKLRAFSGSSMNQMKNIRDQQEKLSKLHFDLGTNTSETKSSSDHMAQLVQRLNEISHSIEKLNSSNAE
ncbi:hypothetical protein PVAND_004915 [Polypedilum vanderplanki]|uniref:Uncharacterized protein n=1 Tax=Polypedilum vanderplanki TaxID=319348 RepID=A0A9J6BYK7_POLVA|nr:hypothetical protein PVAND_004915 [Polypedilum vanderplanki]